MSRRYDGTLRLCVYVCVCMLEKSHEIGAHTPVVHGVAEEGSDATRYSAAVNVN